jgi:feruloyl-CoA synthase
VRTTGHRVPMSTSWGTTETAPLATAAHFLLDRAGNVGLPAPGVEMKLVPSGGKLEIRVRGPNIMPGYWKRPDLTADAFDEEGFYKPGDAVRLADENDCARGLIFDGPAGGGLQAHDRHLGARRRIARRCARGLFAGAAGRESSPGADRAFVALLCWLNSRGLPEVDRRQCAGRPARPGAHPAVREHVRRSLGDWNAAHPGSSERVARVLLLGDAPSIDANEITDKGLHQPAPRAGAPRQ